MRTMMICLMGLTGASAFILGCASAPDIRCRVEEEVRKAAEMTAKSAQGRAEQTVAELSDEPNDLLCRVILSNRQYHMALDDMRLADVQREDAKWLPWPRLITESWMEFPVGDGGTGSHFSGGLFLRFNLIRAFLYKNAVTIAEVMQTISQQKRVDAASEAASTFLGRVIELDAALQEQEQNIKTCKLADQAVSEAETLFKAGQLSSDRWHAWKKRRMEKEVESQLLAMRLQKARLDLAQSCPEPYLEKDVLAYVERYTERLEAEAGQPRVESYEILMKEPGVTKAKLELFSAEVAIMEARLKRLPNVWFDVGAGNIALRGDNGNDYNGLVPMAGMSMTLFDFGEISRGVERAELQAKKAREQLLLAVEVARVQRDLTKQKKNMTSAALASAGKRCEATRTSSAETGALMRAGNASIMDFHEAEWMSLDADALRDRYRIEYRQALIAERMSRGEVLDEPMRKQVFFGCTIKETDETK